MGEAAGCPGWLITPLLDEAYDFVLHIDHVLIAVADLEAAAREFEVTYGLASLEGGRHPGWGTANRIVPLGESYLELVTVVDAADAAGNDFGRRVAAADAEAGYPMLGWVVRTQELDQVARRLGLRIDPGSRVTPSGDVLQWRSAGLDQPDDEPSLPFFIEWSSGSAFPGHADIVHPAGSAAITRLELAADVGRLQEWLGPHDLPITIHSGTPSLQRLVITTASGETVFGV